MARKRYYAASTASVEWQQLDLLSMLDAAPARSDTLEQNGANGVVNVYQQDPQQETTTSGKDGNDGKREGNGLEGQGNCHTPKLRH